MSVDYVTESICQENRQRPKTQNWDRIHMFSLGEESEDGEEKIRKAGGGSSRKPEKKAFQKEEVTNSIKHYGEVK